MTPRWRTAVLLLGASLLISTTAVRSTLAARRSETAGPVNVVIEAQASNYVGMGGCASSQCHTRVKEWAEKLDGDGKPRGKQHYNALNQLDAGRFPDVKKYLAAVNAKDAFQEKTCLDCHSTPDGQGDFEGVTCENCHGAGKQYRDKHDKVKGAGVAPYISLGMKDLKGPGKWVPLCIDCHVLDSSAKERSLAGAGHPNGSDFDVTKAFLRVQGPKGSHWATRNYTSNDVAPFVPAKPKPAPTPVTPAAPPAAPTSAPPAPPTAAPATTPVTAPATPAANPSPTPGPGTRPVVTTAPAPVTAVVPPVPPAIKPVVTPKVTPVVAPPPAPPDTRPMPSAEAAPVTSAPLVGTPSAEPRTMSGLIASVQGRLINVLTSLLRQNATVPQRVVPPAKPAVYSGPDRDLLKLQDDIISLALEVLGKAPGKGGSQ